MQTYLKQISHVRRYITTEATKTLVQGLVMSKFDYCNALYNGLPDLIHMCSTLRVWSISSLPYIPPDPELTLATYPEQSQV